MRKHTLLALLVALALCLALGACKSSSSSTAPRDSAPTEGVSALSDSLVRQTQAGLVRGKEAANDTWAWLGIPYAKPPVGVLRWRAPRDPDPWTGVREAGHPCRYCVQYGNYLSETGPETLSDQLIGGGVPTGSEDCLYLNLWRPRSDATKLPVFVYIYGGGNIIGRSDLSIYDGAHFAAHNNMILLTVNYRLGYFGWFRHPALREDDNPLENSGNFGTLDLIKALQWIRDNIAAFGGDPDNVTISGQSAGGMNIYSLMASPLAKGLFHRAVVFSGFSQACAVETAEQKAQAMLERLLRQDGYGAAQIAARTAAGNAAWIRDYLRSKSVAEIYHPDNCGPMAMPLDALMSAEAIMGIYVDGYVIPASPEECLRSGSYHRVPLLMGCTKEELKLFVPMLIMPPADLWRAVQAFDPEHPADYDITPFLKPYSWPLMALYGILPPLGQVAFQANGTDKLAPLARQHQEDVYVYKFLWQDEPAPFDYIIGAAHAMDLPFIFGNFISDKASLTAFAWNEANREGREWLSYALMTYLGQFARTGNPNGANPALPRWSPWSPVDGQPKRMTFNRDAIAMSSARVEPAEVCLTCEAKEILALIQGLIKG